MELFEKGTWKPFKNQFKSWKSFLLWTLMPNSLFFSLSLILVLEQLRWDMSIFGSSCKEFKKSVSSWNHKHVSRGVHMVFNRKTLIKFVQSGLLKNNVICFGFCQFRIIWKWFFLWQKIAFSFKDFCTENTEQESSCFSSSFV